MTIRGFFPNPRHILRPGQYGKVRAALEVKTGALLVPQRAVIELQGGYRVAVVGPDSKADDPGGRAGPARAATSGSSTRASRPGEPWS